MKNLLIAVLLAAPLALAAPDARAQAPDDQTRAAARALSLEADAAWNKHDYATAYDRFSRAFELVKALPLAVRQAECLVKLGKLVEASERYTFVAGATVAPNAQKVVKDAITTARKELDALRPRLPMLELAVEAEGDQSTLLVDGKPVSRALWGAKMPINPGNHTVELSRGEEKATDQISIAEGESKRLDLRLPPMKKSATPASDTSTAVQPPQTSANGEQSSSASRTWGWIGIGVGGAGLAFGAVTGVMALNKQSSLDDAGCVDGRCPPGTSADVDSYNTLRTLSTVGFGVGLAGVAVGSVLFATAPSEPRAREKTALRGWIGPGSAGLAGTF